MLIGVVAHVNRVHLVDELINDVDVDIIKFDDGLPSITGCANNHIRVLKALNECSHKDKWCVVLEDDAQPVTDFREQLVESLALADTALVGLYLGTGSRAGSTQKAIIPAIQAAEDTGSNWVVSDWFMSCVGYAVKSSWLPCLIDALSNNGGPVDNRINEWSHRTGFKTWYTYPSLVNHKDEQSLISSAGVPLPVRHAWCSGGRDVWHDGCVRMGYAEGWSPAK